MLYRQKRQYFGCVRRTLSFKYFSIYGKIRVLLTHSVGKFLTMYSCACKSAVSPLSGSPISDIEKKGEFITPPRPTGMRSKDYAE